VSECVCVNVCESARECMCMYERVYCAWISVLVYICVYMCVYVYICVYVCACVF